MAGAAGGLGAILFRLAVAPALSLTGSRRFLPFLARARQEDLAALADLAGIGRLTPVIDRAHLLSEAAEAVRYVGTGRARGKVVIRVA
jgi:NADPH:quinone reductase-like Zn-dependent oxidoreductase